ncbi:hypothetical protein IKQ26_07240 [bacterium]|nr:hypothetical protein [bacterium]
MKKLFRIFSIFFIILFFVLLTAFAVYMKGLPYLVSNQKFIGFIKTTVKKHTNTDLTIIRPILKTDVLPELKFQVEKIELSKEGAKLFELDDFVMVLSFAKIFKKTVIVDKLLARNVFADVNSLEELAPNKEKKEKKEKESPVKVEIDDSLLAVHNLDIIYLISPDTKISLHGEQVGVDNTQKIRRGVLFKLSALVERKDKRVNLALSDNGRVYFYDKKFHIDSCPLFINDSEILTDFVADKKQNFEINLYSDNFELRDIIDFLNTQVIENNVSESLVYFSEIGGNLDFKLNIKNDDLNGNFKINNIKVKVKDVDNVPITLTQGNISLTSDEIKIADFKGFYDNNSANKLEFEGSVKDYLKSIDTEIEAKALVRNDFFKKHLSKMLGTDLEIKGEAPTKISLKSKNNIMDLVWYFMLKPSQNIKIGNDFLPFEENYRMMKSEMHLENMVLDINSIDYHMISKSELAQARAQRETNPNEKREKPKPIFTLSSQLDLAKNNDMKYLSFEIPEPLPSELLNAVLNQNVFKKGKISGKLLVDNRGDFPVLNGNMRMDKVLIPSQMTFIKDAVLETKGRLIHLNSEGGYRRSKFSFNGDILNELKFPIVIKNVNLSLESLDLYKLLELFNDQTSAEDVITTDSGVIASENTDSEFDIRNLIIEKCRFHLTNGVYKEIEFGNLDADLTLDKNGVIDIKSNRFDFAQGESSLRANFDLINKKYNVKLGVLRVDSDTIANALLDLKKEITGKASGFMDLTTDDSMKLNGTIKFKISDGTIEKMGLVEYVLKCASLFRNAISMINPATLSDIVRVPEGDFEKITGELTLRNNVATRIKIKTYSAQLSNYITGRYNIENGDTSMRIYTKFSDVKKGFTGYLRKISLNSLANRIQMNSQNDLNYYAIELQELPEIQADEKDCQIFLTKFEGDVANNNYISSLKKIK